jgi:tetratricopeptide (TPR) repeat protein
MASNLNDLMTRANQALAMGRFEECKRLCSLILDELPGNLPVLVLKGMACSKAGDAQDAVDLFKRAVAVDPRSAAANLWLSLALQGIGQLHEATSFARKAVALTPGDPFALDNLGSCLISSEQFDAALVPLQKAASIAPNIGKVHYSIGLALHGLKRYDEAVKALRRSAQIDPNSSLTFLALLNVLTDQVDLAGAIEAGRALVRLEPNSAEANLRLARALLEDSQATEADEYVRKAMTLDPDTSLGHFLLGSVLQMGGQIQEAGEHFQRSIELLPRQGPAYLALVSNRKVKESDRLMIGHMEDLVVDPELAAVHVGQLHYALGKAYDDLGDYRMAMAHFDEANRLAYVDKFGDAPFDRRASQDATQRTIATFSTEFFSRNRHFGTATDLPIFVVGMIRSGTTLAEQILSCHPAVGAAGEQMFWITSGYALIDGKMNLNTGLVGMFADKYLSLLKAIDPSKRHVVDKMPMNYMVIGVIHAVFPYAKIIHIKRHPVDTCISIYSTPNRTRLRWAHDKANIVFNYRQYQSLMEHWRRTLPEGTMLDIEYEDMVGDLETAARSIVAFCGLEWDDACLRPHDNERSVVTPSVWQVRQPVYRTSMARWKKYEKVLGPFNQLMGDAK